MAQVEEVLAQAERHVREGEGRLVRQAALVARMEAQGLDPSEARAGLVQLRRTLALWRADLHRMRAACFPETTPPA